MGGPIDGNPHRMVLVCACTTWYCRSGSIPSGAHLLEACYQNAKRDYTGIRFPCIVGVLLVFCIANPKHTSDIRRLDRLSRSTSLTPEENSEKLQKIMNEWKADTSSTQG